MSKLLGALAALLLVSAPNGVQRSIQHVDSLEYPRLAWLARIEGDVQLEVQVDPEGQVHLEKGISGHPLLKEAAEENVRGWRFQPGQTEELTITYTFKLEQPERQELSSRCSFDFPDRVTVVAHLPAPIG